MIREPRPIETEGTLVFPDFELVNRRNPRHRWLLEIIGFLDTDAELRPPASQRLLTVRPTASGRGCANGQ